MAKQARYAVRRRKTRRPIQTPRDVAGAVADLSAACRRRAFLAGRTGDEKAKHVWLQLAQTGECAMEWILPLLRDDPRHAARESQLSGGRNCVIRNRRDTLARK